MSATWPHCSGATLFARPAADDIWAGPAQRAALHRMLGPEPEKWLLGAPSSGKSTLLRHLATRLDDAVLLRCGGPKNGAPGILSALLASVELVPWDLSEVEQRNLLTVFVQQRRAQRKRVALLFDDVQRYDAGARDELTRLRALHAAGQLGHLMILASTAAPPDAAAVPGVTAVHALPPAGPGDIDAYLRWRLAPHGVSIHVTATATRLLQRLSDGRYGAVDVLFQMVLLLLKRTGARRVDAQLVQTAAARLTRGHRAAPRPPRAGLPAETAAQDDAGSATEAAAQPAAGSIGESAADAPSRAPAGELLITRDGTLLARRPLAAKVLIGRNEHNDVYLASPHLSRHHAVIFGTAEGYYVADLNSANGVSVNGKRVAHAVLKNGDIVSLGPFRLKVVLAHAAAGEPLPGGQSLADTAIMSRSPDEPRLVRRVK